MFAKLFANPTSTISVALLACAFAAAQTQAPQAPTQRPLTAPLTPATAPDVAQFTQVLAQIDQASQQTNLDLAQLRIEKWKTGGDHKQQSQADAESLMKNLSAALPGMVSASRITPNALAPALKLYRDLNALYDVLAGLTESAGAFGPKEDFNALTNDMRAIDAGRRNVGDYLDALAAYRDAEVTRLAQQVAATKAETPKKIVVDDEAPPPPKHKKSRAKAKPAANAATKPNSTTPPVHPTSQNPQ